MSEPPSVVDNTAAQRLETTVEGHVASLAYRREDERLVLVHTEVPDEASGRGVGGALVRAAISQAVEQGLTVVPQCPFARRWLEKHPDIAGRVTIDWPARSG